MTGLDALKEINKVIPYAHITNEYKIIEKELKALEIIKEKRVNVDYFIRFYKDKYYNEYLVDTQFTIGKQISETPLTQKEFDLLKEILL